MGDVLIFLPGEREIRDAHQALERRKYRHTEVLPLYARLSARDQDRVFNPGPQRRIVLATNVAETSLTVPRIHYVVDPGLARVKRYSPRQKLDRLHIEPVSQASADQRKGRCGRIAPGICYRLYAEADFASRPRLHRSGNPPCRAGRRDPAHAVAGPRRIEDFPFLEPPDPRAIADGWQQLQRTRRRRCDSDELTADRPHHGAPAGGREAGAHAGRRAGPRLPARDAGDRVVPRHPGSARAPADQRAAADNAHAQFADPKSEFVGILKLWEAYRVAHEELDPVAVAQLVRPALPRLPAHARMARAASAVEAAVRRAWLGCRQPPTADPWKRCAAAFPPFEKGGQGGFASG